MSNHTVKAEWDGDARPFLTLQCNAPLDAMCHARFDCDCDEYGPVRVADDGHPYHEDAYADEAVEHHGRFDANECGLREWFDASSGDALYGELTFPVAWDGDDYTFEVVEN